MRSSVYLETTVISYLAAWPSRDLVMAAHQQLTHEWWQRRRAAFDLYISQAVVEEASRGDADAVQRRLALIDGLERLDVTDEAVDLGEEIAREADMPEKAAVDALHVAIAAAHGVEYLLTWNLKHIAGARFRPRIEWACRAAGYEPPVLCTPADLLER